MSVLLRNTVAVCALSLVMAGTAAGQPGVIRRAAEPIPDSYVVIVADDEDPLSVGLQAAAVNGGRLRYVYENAIRGFSIQLTPAAAEALARDPRVLSIEEDSVLRITDTQLLPPWGLDRIDQRILPLNLTYNYPPPGQAVFVHVLDTGIRSTHVEFGGRAFIAGDFIDDDGDGDPNDVGNDDGDPTKLDGADCRGHGTHVAGTIGGATYGVAKNATLLAYRVLNCSGDGTLSSVLGGIDRVTADTRRPAVANMSLSGSPSPTLDEAVRGSIAAGITYVLSAGNDAKDASLASPARVTEAITVAASTQLDVRASFSNFGSTVDLFAPGVSIQSAYFTSDTATAFMSGTSMAAPHVAGVAALYLQINGNRTAAQVRDALVANATLSLISDLLGSPNRLLYSGFLTSAPPPPPPPAPSGTNAALAANGGVASGSSVHATGYPAGATINGDRKGLNVGSGGVWADGTPSAFPDWLQVDFAASYNIGRIDVVTLQDTAQTPVEPTSTLTFATSGITAYDVQYWTGTAWATVPGGAVTGNTNVWRTFLFTPVTTTKIRVLINGSATTYSFLTEVEAWGEPTPAPEPPPPPPPPPPSAPVNVALASNGGTAIGSSIRNGNYPAAATINGDRKGLNLGAGGVWADGTRNAYPDWLQVNFAATSTINRIDVITAQDGSTPVEPTATLTFTKSGVTAFAVQYWTGAAWATVPGGSVTGNNKVWRTFTFPAVATDKIRVLITGSASATKYSYLTEVEAYTE